MLARALVHEKTYNPASALDAYLHWYDSPPFDIGGTTAAALGGAKRGQTPDERLKKGKASANAASQANGSLMRISPLGIFGAANPIRAAEWARADSSLTHPNPVCQGACAVFVAAIATVIAEGGSPRTCFNAALKEAERSAAHETVVRALKDAESRAPADYQRKQGWVLIALQNAFYQLLHRQPGGRCHRHGHAGRRHGHERSNRRHSPGSRLRAPGNPFPLVAGPALVPARFGATYLAQPRGRVLAGGRLAAGRGTLGGRIAV